jgi:hypothetical protein
MDKKNQSMTAETYQLTKIMPIFFLQVTVIINLKNWAFYYIKIGEMASLK